LPQSSGVRLRNKFLLVSIPTLHATAKTLVYAGDGMDRLSSTTRVQPRAGDPRT